MAANKRALRLVKAMDYLSTKSSLVAFENNSLILNKVCTYEDFFILRMTFDKISNIAATL